MQCRRIAPDVFESVTFVHLFPQRAIFLLEFAALHRARDQQFNLVEIERLGDEIVSTAFHRLHCEIHRAVSGHHDADRRTRNFQCTIDQDHPVFAAEAEIGEEHIDLLALEHVHRASDVGGDVHVVIVLEQTAQSVARVLLVVNDQDNGLESHGFAWLNR